MHAVIWVLAVLSHWTVLHRVYHTWRELEREAIEAKAQAQAASLAEKPEDSKSNLNDVAVFRA